MKTCIRCGKELDTDYEYLCWHCGATQSDNYAEKTKMALEKIKQDTARDTLAESDNE